MNKLIITLAFSLFLMYTPFNFLQAATETVIVKVSDVCEAAAGETCTVGQNGNMTVKVCDMKNKTGGSDALEPDMPDDPFDCPQGYTTFNDYFLPDHSGTGTGLGVIDGLMYFNESNPLDEFYYWAWDTSLIFDNYDDWAAEMEAQGKPVDPWD